MRVTCIQMCSGDDVTANLGVVSSLLEQAAAEKVRLAVLPENFSFMHPDNTIKHHVAAEVVPATVLPFLAETARRHGMYIIGGSVLMEAESGKLRNACPVYGPDGACLGIYDKMHLFDIDLPGESYRESDLIEEGLHPLILDLEEWRVGLSICYDLRFPELYRLYAARGCHLLTVPSAFTVRTGRAHWEILLRARAIENQTYLLAPAQVGTHPGGRQTYGRSLIIDPWGDVLAEGASVGQGAETTLVTADIAMERLEEVRRLIPALEHRRLRGEA
jgi:deaminated glutathione amidase